MSMHKQFSRGSTSSSHRSVSLTRSTVLDADAIKTSVATSDAVASYSGTDLDGADVGADNIARPTPSGHTGVAQYPIAASAAHTGSYVVASAITFTGTYGGVSAVRTATVGSADGNETLIADGPLDTVSQIDVAAQADALGAWTFGFDDVACKGPDSCVLPFRELAPTSTGAVKITCGGGDVDTVAGLAATSLPLKLEVRRVHFSDGATTLTTLRLHE
jgi:hypothetical protein